jgi:tetratricopeptide (TPR) repeat protein
VHKGSVFSVYRIADESGRAKAHRLEWALLEVLDRPTAGSCRCRHWHRFQEDSLTPAPGTLGFRAALVATAVQPVRVQLLDDASLQPLDGIRVRVQKPGGGKLAELITNRDGVAATREDFPHFALVQVLSGEQVRAQLPVELIPGRTAIARVRVGGDGESLTPFLTRRDAWLRRIYENARMSTERSRNLSAQLHQSLGAALEAGKKSLPALDAEIKYLEGERDQLRTLAKEKKWTFDPREGDREIAGLNKQAKDLSDFVMRIENVLKDPGSEKSLGLVQLLERARLLENEAEFDQAIRLYEQVVQASPGEKQVEAHLGKLKKAWAPVNAAHEEARAFLTKAWPALDVAALAKNLDEAAKALAICKAAGDKLTPIKFVRANAAHTANLTKQLDTLKRRDSEDNRNRAKALAQTGETLSRLHQEAAEWIGAK